MPQSMHSQGGDVPPAEFLDAFDITSSQGDTSIYFGSFVLGVEAVPAENLPARAPHRRLRRIVTFGNHMRGHLCSELMAVMSQKQLTDTLSYLSIVLANRGAPPLVLPTPEQIQAVADALQSNTHTPGNAPASPADAPAPTALIANGSALTAALNATRPPAPAAPAADPAAGTPDAAPAVAAAQRPRAPAPRVPHQVGASR